MGAGAGVSEVGPVCTLLPSGAVGAPDGAGPRDTVLQAAMKAPTIDIVASRSARWMDFTGSLRVWGWVWDQAIVGGCGARPPVCGIAPRRHTVPDIVCVHPVVNLLTVTSRETC